MSLCKVCDLIHDIVPRVFLTTLFNITTLYNVIKACLVSMHKILFSMKNVTRKLFTWPCPKFMTPIQRYSYFLSFLILRSLHGHAVEEWGFQKDRSLHNSTINIYYESVINCGNAQNSLCLLFKSSYHVFGLQTQVQTDRVDTTHRWRIREHMYPRLTRVSRITLCVCTLHIHQPVAMSFR